jgi:hypothetical protein
MVAMVAAAMMAAAIRIMARPAIVAEAAGQRSHDGAQQNE